MKSNSVHVWNDEKKKLQIKKHDDCRSELESIPEMRSESWSEATGMSQSGGDSDETRDKIQILYGRQGEEETKTDGGGEEVFTLNIFNPP